MFDHPLWWWTRIIMANAQCRQNAHVFVLNEWKPKISYTILERSPWMTWLTWKTNSNELAGMATCCVSAILPETAIQTFADVIVGPFFLDGKMTTRYGSSVNSKKQNLSFSNTWAKKGAKIRQYTNSSSGMCLWSKNSRPCSALANGTRIVLSHLRTVRTPNVCTACVAAPCPKGVFGNALTTISSPTPVEPKLWQSQYEFWYLSLQEYSWTKWNERKLF